LVTTPGSVAVMWRPLGYGGLTGRNVGTLAPILSRACAAERGDLEGSGCVLLH
jgi:hypothetical protein